MAAVKPAAACPNFSVFPQRNCPKQGRKGEGVSGSLVNFCLDCENANFESSSKTSSKEPEDCNTKWPFASRLKPRSSVVTMQYLPCSVYQCRLTCAQQGGTVWHQGDQKRRLSLIPAPRQLWPGCYVKPSLVLLTLWRLTFKATSNNCRSELFCHVMESLRPCLCCCSSLRLNMCRSRHTRWLELTVSMLLVGAQPQDRPDWLHGSILPGTLSSAVGICGHPQRRTR